MLEEKNIQVRIECQQFKGEDFFCDIEEKRSVIIFESMARSEDVPCPFCGGRVYEDGTTSKHLKDIPVWSGVAQTLNFICHRYECRRCGKKFTEDIPLRYPGTRITERAATWIKSLLLNKISIKAIQDITGIHWETIRKIHTALMETTIQKHTEELIMSGYCPRYLAVDEFAIHKGHTYATCVMDLESGEVLWVGRGRGKEDFRAFFQEVQPSFLADVQAIAMDMNASYNILVKEYLPNAEIVYDRYHMQAQYGKDVLGVVRLNEARKHKALSQELHDRMSGESKENQQDIRKQMLEEKHQYSRIKKLRWTLLTNGEKLSEHQHSNLNDILDNHSDLSVCYAMKEEMISLFQLRNRIAAEAGWQKWFAAAKESGIPALVRFAELKEKRIGGLIAHATHPISTGKLEGFNNKIKVAKRVGYGFRNDNYFFLLVRALSLSPKFP